MKEGRKEGGEREGRREEGRKEGGNEGGGREEKQSLLLCNKRRLITGFPGGAVVENLPANAGDTRSSPGLGRSHMPRSN